MKNIIIAIILFSSPLLYSVPASTPSDEITEQLLRYQVLTNLRWADKKLDRNSFYHAQLNDCSMPKTVWRSNDLGASTIRGGDYSGSYFFSDRLEKATLDTANFSETSFIGSRIHKVHMERITITKSFFMKSLIRRANMNEARISGTNFSGSNFSNVNLSHAALENVDFSGSILNKLNLKGAHLKNVNFSDAHISNFSIDGALIYDERLKDYRKLRITDLIAGGAMVSMKDRFLHFF